MCCGSVGGDADHDVTGKSHCGSQTMKRSKPLRRKTPLRARGKGKYARRVRDRVYMRKVKRLPCAVRWFARWSYNQIVWDSWGPIIATPCSGRLEADHQGERPGAFRKGSDRCVVEMCKRHHGERTNLTGTFSGWTPEAMKAFREVAVKAVQQEMAELEERDRRWRQG